MECTVEREYALLPNELQVKKQSHLDNSQLLFCLRTCPNIYDPVACFEGSLE